MKKSLVSMMMLIMLSITVVACSSSGGKAAQSTNAAGRKTVQDENKAFAPPDIKNLTEYHNYMNAQKLYDDPSTIIWCTTTWGNASAPLVTIPVAGKLTSSSVALFPSTQTKVDTYDREDFFYNSELPSVDGMFHGTPPPYRYGFTPGGQYVDFFNMPTLCTTALTSFQRQSTKVSVTVDPSVTAAQGKAEAALKKCQAGNIATVTVSTNCPAAQAALASALGG